MRGELFKGSRCPRAWPFRQMEDWRGERHSQEKCCGVQQEKDGAMAAKSGGSFSVGTKKSIIILTE